jgi:hypothetical protein
MEKFIHIGISDLTYVETLKTNGGSPTTHDIGAAFAITFAQFLNNIEMACEIVKYLRHELIEGVTQPGGTNTDLQVNPLTLFG